MSKTKSKTKNIGVLVLGEIGRSPRMQYHSLSISKTNPDKIVRVIGLKGPAPLQELREQKNVKFCHIPQVWKFLPRNPLVFLFTAPIKLFLQVLMMFWMFVKLPKLSHLIIQNPPAIPTLFVVWIYSFFSNCQIIIDWHNFGYTILALKPRLPTFIVKIAYRIEKFFSSRKKYKHICVSNTMREWLKKTWKINAITLYDKPAKIFKELNLDEKHAFFEEFFKDNFNEENIFTTVSENEVIENSIRPALLVSSTSWTKDEDFGILLSALKMYDENKIGPDLFVVITGKGPMKGYYQKEINNYKWKRVTIKLAWLKMEDYPKLLGSADLGISLHYSSSGIDLPMKVVDMFGCNLPVLAVSFEALKELVVHEENGLVFSEKKMLYLQICEVLEKFPNEKLKLEKFRKNLRKKNNFRWDNEWKKIENLFKE